MKGRSDLLMAFAQSVQSDRQRLERSMQMWCETERLRIGRPPHEPTR